MEPDTAHPPEAGDQRRASVPALTVFLDNHDAACPECGYSLRGIKNDHCPECGWVISLRPSDGIDRDRVLRLTRWVALIGLVISTTKLLEPAMMLLSSGGGFGLPGAYLVFYSGHILLLALSLSTLVSIRRLRVATARALLRSTTRLTRLMGILILLVVIVPFLLRLFMMSMWD